MRLQRVLAPELVFPAVYLLFLVLALLAYRIEATARYLVPAFQELHSGSVVLTLMGVALAVAGMRLGRSFELDLDPRYLLPPMALLSLYALQSTFPEQTHTNIAISLGSVAFWLVFTRLGNARLLLIGAYALAVAAVALTLSQGIPLLEASFRQSVAVSPARAVFHGLAVLSAALLATLASLRYALPGIALLAFLGVLSGFKSDAIAVILSATIAGLISGRVSLRGVASALAGVMAILSVVSTHIASVAYSTWKIPPHLYVFYRTGFTFSVFDRIVELSLPLGILHGSALLDVSQTTASRVVLGYEREHIITSTLFGPAVLDFGIPGLVATALLIGVYLGAMHRLASGALGTASYSVALTHVLILIEVGLQPTSVLFLLTLLYLSLSREVLERC
jgi:hypothetical protein